MHRCLTMDFFYMLASYLALFLAQLIWTTEGALTFTKEPKSPIFFKEGDDAVFKWLYSEANKAAELDSIIWRAKNKTDGKSYALIVETADGTVTVNPNIPSAYRGRVDKIGQATLVIKRITLDDSTSFTCTLISKTGPGNDKGSDPVELIVTGLASVADKVQCADVGSSASLTCNATNVPSQNFTWMREGQTVVSRAQHLVDNVDGSSQLTIKNVTISDHGYYICDAAVNADSQNSASGYLQVPCQVPLQQDNTSCPKSFFSVTKNEILSICCPVSGYPPPIVTWKKNGTQLQQGKNTVFTIARVKDKDLGNYTCTATDYINTIGPFIITVSKTVDDLFVRSAIDGTAEKAAKLEMQPHPQAENYVVKIEGKDILEDFVVGAKPTLEVHYHTLVMEELGEKPPEIDICAEVFAMNDKGVIAKTPTCQKLTIKKPSDTKI